MDGLSFGWGRLGSPLLELGVQAGPAGCAGGPDVLLRRNGRGVIEGTQSDHPQIRTRRGVAVDMAAASGTKQACDGVAAVGLAGVFGQDPADFQ